MNFIKKEPKIFIVSGKARSGKGEISKLISEYYSNKKSIIISFGHYIKEYAKNVSNWDGSEDTKPRELLQNLGIELIKNKIDNKLFIRRILEDIEVYSYFYDVIIINDARLLDEITSIKNKYNNDIINFINNRYNINIDSNIDSYTLEDNVFINNFHEFIWPDLNNNIYDINGTCYALKDHIGILVDGTIIPCCLDSLGIINLGNIYKDTISDIKNSNRVKNMIDGFNNNTKCEELCRHCKFIEKD